ncbi:MAG: hypothetical protein KDH94_08430, partial [Coxiellaceae bacterium]|nr:hypothetical protein [Coxiellaceae bacterium]
MIQEVDSSPSQIERYKLVAILRTGPAENRVSMILNSDMNSANEEVYLETDDVEIIFAMARMVGNRILGIYENQYAISQPGQANLLAQHAQAILVDLENSFRDIGFCFDLASMKNGIRLAPEDAYLLLRQLNTQEIILLPTSENDKQKITVNRRKLKHQKKDASGQGRSNVGTGLQIYKKLRISSESKNVVVIDAPPARKSSAKNQPSGSDGMPDVLSRFTLKDTIESDLFQYLCQRAVSFLNEQIEYLGKFNRYSDVAPEALVEDIDVKELVDLPPQMSDQFTQLVNTLPAEKRDYQVADSHLLLRGELSNIGMALNHEMGLGKSIIIGHDLKFWLMQKKGPILLCVPTRVIPDWCDKLTKLSGISANDIEVYHEDRAGRHGKLPGALHKGKIIIT